METIFSIETPYILVTASNDDHCPPFLSYPPADDLHELQMKAFVEKPELKFWFAKNPCRRHYKVCAYPLGPKWQWKTTRFFGEDKTQHLNIYKKLCKTPKESLLNKNKKPTIIIADTIKGKGVSYMEDVTRWHNTMPNENEIEIARKDLEVNCIK